MNPLAGINARVLIRTLPHGMVAHGILYFCVEDNYHDP